MRDGGAALGQLEPLDPRREELVHEGGRARAMRQRQWGKVTFAYNQRKPFSIRNYYII